MNACPACLKEILPQHPWPKSSVSSLSSKSPKDPLPACTPILRHLIEMVKVLEQLVQLALNARSNMYWHIAAGRWQFRVLNFLLPITHRTKLEFYRPLSFLRPLASSFTVTPN